MRKNMSTRAKGRTETRELAGVWSSGHARRSTGILSIHNGFFLVRVVIQKAQDLEKEMPVRNLLRKTSAMRSSAVLIQE